VEAFCPLVRSRKMTEPTLVSLDNCVSMYNQEGDS